MTDQQTTTPHAGPDGLWRWLLGGLAAGGIILGLLIAAYAIGYHHGENKAREAIVAAAPPAQAPTTTEEAATTPATTEQTGAAQGKALFASAGCSGCHTLADAGATGSVGPNLDDAKPSAALVVDRVTHGKGAMPSFNGQLSGAEIEAVAAYVSHAAGG